MGIHWKFTEPYTHPENKILMCSRRNFKFRWAELFFCQLSLEGKFCSCRLRRFSSIKLFIPINRGIVLTCSNNYTCLSYSWFIIYAFNTHAKVFLGWSEDVEEVVIALQRRWDLECSMHNLKFKFKVILSIRACCCLSISFLTLTNLLDIVFCWG